MNRVSSTTVTASIDADQPLAVKPHRSRVREWARLIAITGSAQVAVQAIGFACGILVIRLLPVDEYALYTLANTMLGTMTVLADGGIAAGVMSQGGKVWQDREKLGAVLVTGMELRKKFAVFSLLVATPILFYLLHHHGASWLTATLIVLSLIPAFFSALSGTLLEIVPKLHQDIGPLQRIQVTSNAVRLALTSLFVFAFPLAGVAILASGVAQVWRNLQLRRQTFQCVDNRARADQEVEAEIRKLVKKVLPTAIYFSFASQIGIWILSLFGTTQSVAGLGALSRIAMIVAPMGMVFTYLVAPRFARLPDAPPRLRRRQLQAQAAMWILCATTLALAFVIERPLLDLLPEEYSQLKYEFRVQFGIAVLGLYIGALAAMNTSRGYVMPAYVHIPLNISIIAATAVMIRPTTLQGALHLDLARSVVALLVQNAIFFIFVGGRRA